MTTPRRSQLKESAVAAYRWLALRISQNRSLAFAVVFSLVWLVVWYFTRTMNPLLLFFYLATMLCLMLMRAKSIKTLDDSLPLILELFVSMVTGVVLAASFDVSARSSPGQLDLTSILIPGLVTGSVLFLMQALAHSLATIRRTHERVDELEAVAKVLDASSRVIASATSAAEDAFRQGDYAALAANVMGLQREDFEVTSDSVDGNAPTTLGAGVENLAAAVKTAKKLRRRLGTDVSPVVWWKFLKTYFQEEMYDISNFEVATNVRNYAFSILSLTRALQQEIPDGKKLIVVNVSPFNPKDFYNWPHRVGTHCHYHEAEFFAVYRRAFSKLLRSEGISPLRIIVTAKGNGSAQRRDLKLGWTVDTTSHVRDSLASYRFFSFPVFGSEVATNGHYTDTNGDTGRAKMARAFCDKSLHELAGVVPRIMVTPFIPYKNQGVDERKLPPNAKSLADSAQKIFAEIAADRPQVLLEECARSWKAALNATLQTFEPHVSDCEPLRGAISELSEGGDNWRCLLDSTILRTLENAGFPTGYCTALFEKIGLLVGYSTKLCPNGWGGNESGAAICDILDAAQAADAKLRFLQCFSGSDATHSTARSSFGTEMGTFEEWALFYCVFAYHERVSDSFGPGPHPLWRLFFRDTLAIEETSTESGGVDACIDRALERLRICEIGDDSEVGQLHKAGITPEFALFCLAPADFEPSGGLDTLTPLMLLSTSLSEPFHTCKLRLKLPSAGEDGVVTSHLEWVKSVFNDRRDFTSAELGRLKKDLAGQHTTGTGKE